MRKKYKKEKHNKKKDVNTESKNGNESSVWKVMEELEKGRLLL
jgi:hypothetical protein